LVAENKSTLRSRSSSWFRFTSLDSMKDDEAECDEEKVELTVRFDFLRIGARSFTVKLLSEVDVSIDC
jgi:hypothetical protein